MEKMEFPNDLKMTREQIVAEIKCLVQSRCSDIDEMFEEINLTEEQQQNLHKRKEQYRNIVRYVRENLK